MSFLELSMEIRVSKIWEATFKVWEIEYEISWGYTVQGGNWPPKLPVPTALIYDEWKLCVDIMSVI